MKKIELYRYEDGATIVITPVRRQPEDTPSKYRLIADEGMELTDGTVTVECIDVLCGAVDVWREVEKPEAPIDEERVEYQ